MSLQRPVFTHGQLYVAFLRSTSLQGVKILMDAAVDRKTDNIVFTKVLSDPDIA